MTAPSGLVVVDKPSGLTSHDVVARLRRLAGSRRVGHAGTLDPMATGVLVVGVERATKLLGHLALTDKAYDATIRLGVTTVTDDAQGEVLESAAGSAVDALTETQVGAAVAALTGVLEQVPSAVSAIKVDGKRAYARVRDGEQVELKARTVTVSRFDVVQVRRPASGLLDLDVAVECTTGTYVRALARDLGAALGVGGHLTALRRTRVGPFGIDAARTLDQLAEHLDPLPLDAAVAASFPRLDVDADAARLVSHGRRLPVPVGTGAGPYGVFGPDGAVLALMAPEAGQLRPLVVLAPA